MKFKKKCNRKQSRYNSLCRDYVKPRDLTNDYQIRELFAV
ncbi:hypothetical protein SAMN05444672_10979 [Bacillus sp. OK838]|nr:hypothetical protein SAMN05444672_10979 [Bacillus sp. OK838]